jgi:CRISPR system Cascade subunit CasA
MTAPDEPDNPKLDAPRFSLIDEPWIPVQRLDGTRCELGIRDTLLQADQIAEIQDGSPLVVAALHRLLLAVLYRALEGPTDGQQAKAWFKDGWPLDHIDAYLRKWRDRFWLFHPRYPFAQIPDFEPKTWRAWTVLAAEHNADNAKVLFDHVDVCRAGSIGAAQAARWLQAAQTFSLGGGNSDFGYTKHGPSAVGVMAMPVGKDLRDTLCFMLVPQNRSVQEHDLPLWEREPESVAVLKGTCERHVDGYANRYTWRTRSIHLRADTEECVTQAAFASGVSARAEHQSDPMLAYRIDDKKGRLPVIYRERGFWREFDSLLPDADGNAPQVIAHAITLGRSFPERFPGAVMVAGQANDKAKIEYWRIERFHLPHAMRGDRFVRSELRELLTRAEGVQTALWQACSTFARDMLSHGTREPKEKDVRNVVAQMPTIGAYWSRLEARFHAVLRDYTEARHWEDIRWSWLKELRDALNGSWSQFAASVDSGDAWAIRALARAERPVRQRLAVLAKEIESLNPEKEPA